MYPVDPFIASSNQNCPPIMQLTPKVADYRRMFTIAVDRTSVISAMHSTFENEQYAGIGTGFSNETRWDPDNSRYLNSTSKNIRTIKWFTPAALNSAGKVDGADGSLTENISKTKFEESISDDQLNGLELFIISQHCGPNVMSSALCKYERDATGGNDEFDELEYKGVITIVEWDYENKEYITSSQGRGSYYSYVRIAVHGDKNTLRDNEWCIQYKLDGTIIMHYAPIYEDDVDASPEKRLMVPVLATVMYNIGEGTLTNMEIIGSGRLSSSAPGAVKMANGGGNMMNLDRLKILFNDAGINGAVLTVTNSDLAWACSRTLAGTASWRNDPTTGAASVIRISNNSFRFAQIQSLTSILCGGPPEEGNVHRASPPIEVEGNLFYLPVTTHGR